MIGKFNNCRKIVDIPVCSICREASQCNRYLTKYFANPLDALRAMRKYVDKFPEKYEIGVKMAKETNTRKWAVMINKDGTSEWGDDLSLKKKIIANPEKYISSIVIPASQVMKPVFELKRVKVTPALIKEFKKGNK